MKTYGTFAFLLRWHFLPFVFGVCMSLFAAYQLATYVEPKPTALSAAVSAPALDYFLPAMWLALAFGLFVAGRAFAKAHNMANN